MGAHGQIVLLVEITVATHQSQCTNAGSAEIVIIGKSGTTVFAVARHVFIVREREDKMITIIDQNLIISWRWVIQSGNIQLVKFLVIWVFVNIFNVIIDIVDVNVIGLVWDKITTANQPIMKFSRKDLCWLRNFLRM